MCTRAVIVHDGTASKYVLDAFYRTYQFIYYCPIYTSYLQKVGILSMIQPMPQLKSKPTGKGRHGLATFDRMKLYYSN